MYVYRAAELYTNLFGSWEINTNCLHETEIKNYWWGRCSMWSESPSKCLYKIAVPE